MAKDDTNLEIPNERHNEGRTYTIDGRKVDRRKYSRRKVNPWETIKLTALSMIVGAIITGSILNGVLGATHRGEVHKLETEYITVLQKAETRANRNLAEELRKMRNDNLLMAVKEIALSAEEFRNRLTAAIQKMQPKLDGDIAAKIVRSIITESKKNNLDPLLIAGIMWIESRFDPMAHSSKGAVGLMQVRYSVWKEDPILKKNGVSLKNRLFWIETNISVGTAIFADYYKATKYDVARALKRYNSGKDIPKGKEAHEISYINKVILSAYRLSEMIRK